MIALDFELPLGRRRLEVRAELPEAFTAVMGPSGAGKTSLLETVAGLRGAARGRIELAGTPVLDSRGGLRVPPERRRVGYVPQDAGLFPHLSVAGNVGFAARDPEALAEAVEVLEIGDLLERRPETLSGGERQRVSLARALATRPRALLLDEPLAALDVGLRERIVPFLLRLRAEWRVPALYVTHNAGEALALADHVLLLRDGAVEAAGAPLDLLASPGFAREAEAGIENLLTGRVAGHDPDAGTTRVALDEGPGVAMTLQPGLPLGARVTLAIRAEDVVVAREHVAGLSARNLYEARILGLERTGVDVTLRCELDGGGRPWLVRLTPAAVAALGLEPDRTVWLAVKSHSVRRV